MENIEKKEKIDDYYSSFAPGEDETKEHSESLATAERDKRYSILFGCCECSVVGCRILMTVTLVIVTCILSIIFSIIDIVNDGKDTASFLFWFFVLTACFFCYDTVLIAILCVKGIPCLPSNSVMSYSLLPYYLIVQAVFVIFMIIQVIINAAQWTIQLFPKWRGKVPLELDIVHIVVNVLLLIFFVLILCCVGLLFLSYPLAYFGRKGYLKAKVYYYEKKIENKEADDIEMDGNQVVVDMELKKEEDDDSDEV